MNLPNKLSILRVIMVPLFVAVLVIPPIPETVGSLADNIIRIIAAVLFVITALTDMLDGMIARKYNMITDFGKFIDPLADKFMVFGAMLAILYRFEYLRPIFIWAALIVIFRELAITSMRLIVSSNSGIVVAAKWLGKVKTVTQVICILTILLEPVFTARTPLADMHIFAYLTIIAMMVMTIWSGVDYIKSYWKVLDPTK